MKIIIDIVMVIQFDEAQTQMQTRRDFIQIRSGSYLSQAQVSTPTLALLRRVSLSLSLSLSLLSLEIMTNS